MLIETEKPPNKQISALGELIRKAREDAGLTQAQLAKNIHRKRLAVSEMENGKVEISAQTIPLLASSLDKPISYFFPAYVEKEITTEQLSPQEQELLIHFRTIWPEHLREVAIDLIKVIGNFDPMKLIKDRRDTINAYLKREEELDSFDEQRRKKE
jgi:transcriptional regulator with XRE-family HTH domain